MTRETCCGNFPESICGDCPHATAEQRAQGGVAAATFKGTGARCTDCFEPRDAHLGAELACPPVPVKEAPPPPPAVVQVAVAQPASPAPRVPSCPSCKRAWDGVRAPKGLDGVYCGTCGRQMHFS